MLAIDNCDIFDNVNRGISAAPKIFSIPFPVYTKLEEASLEEEVP